MSVRHVRKDPQTAYCGRPLTQFDWAFIDLSHAVASREQGTLIQPCKRCMKAAQLSDSDKGEDQ